jgi:ribosomal protein L37E
MGLLALILAASVGLALTFRGLRGVRLDDHPLCRRCGYDLYGAPAGTTTCTECGADLARPRAMKIGHRRPVVRR